MVEGTSLSDDVQPFTKMRPLNLKAITIGHLWLAAPFFIVFIKAFRVPLQLMDFWWHLKMGEIIVSTRSIPRTDIFSYTAAGMPFIDQNWLAEVLYFKLYQLGGLPFLILLNTVLLAAALLPILLLCRESTNRIRLAALATLLPCLAFAGNARPQTFSFALFAFFYWILDEFRCRHRDRLWLLPLAMIFWVNLHGAFVVGLGLTAIVLGLEFTRRIFNPAAKDILSAAQLRKLAFVFMACVVATLANPETYKVYQYIRVVISDQASRQMVTEWQTPSIASIAGAMFYCMIGITIAGFCFSRRWPNITDLALFVCFSAFGITAYRNTIWFALIIAPILARYWTRILPAKTTGLPAPNTASGDLESGRPHRLNFIFACVAVFVVIMTSPWIRPTLYGISLLDPKTPVKAIDYIEQHSLQGHIFHPQIYGDYLIWRLYPWQHSYLDGRVHLFGPDFIREYFKTFHDPNWEAKLASIDVQYLLLSKDEKACRDMIDKARSSGHWVVLYEDSISTLLSAVAGR